MGNNNGKEKLIKSELIKNGVQIATSTKNMSLEELYCTVWLSVLKDKILPMFPKFDIRNKRMKIVFQTEIFKNKRQVRSIEFDIDEWCLIQTYPRRWDADFGDNYELRPII